jgi:hypothetical protein
MMKVLGFLAAATIACVAALAQGTKTDAKIPVVLSTRLQLRAEMETATVKLGAPVVVKFRLKNAYSAAIRIGDTWEPYDYELLVTDASGGEPPRTAVGQRIFRGEYGVLHSDSIDLQPGQEIEATLDISTIYQLTQPGTYSVRAMRNKIFGDAAEMSLRNPKERAKSIEKAASNVVQFTIVP